MKKNDIELINETLSVLIDQPLRHLGRAGSLITANFGELVESDEFCHDENGEVVRDENDKGVLKKTMVGKYAMNVECSMRLTCGDEIIFAKSDISLPNTKLANEIDFDWDKFDWTVVGSNYYDEMADKYIGEEPFGFIVKKVDTNKYGDLSITFENDFVLEFFADGSTGSENWCFYEVEIEKVSLVVTGGGIKKDEENDDNENLN